MALSENGFKLADLIVKGLLGALIAGAISFYGSVLQNERETVREENSRLQAAIELTSKQKDLDVQLGMQMFGTLMTYYFKRDHPVARGESVRQQMLLLRLIAINFQDVPIQLAPLFEELNSQLKSEEDRATLRSVAQEVARRQASRLTIEHGLDSQPRRVRAGDEVKVPDLLTRARIESVGNGSVRATLMSELVQNETIGPFTVTYFDSPIVDNTRLGEYRFSLLLHKTEGPEAEVRLIAFPRYLAADRFDVKELSRSFRDRRMN